MSIDVSFFDSSEFWKAIAFILSVAIVVFPAYRFIVKKTRERNKEIVARFQSALDLERQAQETLNAVEEKLKGLDADKQQIMKSAKLAADELKKDFDSNLQSVMLRREKENEERVCLIRENGLKGMQDKFLEIAVDMTKTILTDEQIMSKNALTESSLNELQSILQDEKNVKLLQNRLLEEG